ncbi:uncharacterized protein TM35_000011500 [Trypanosoma theileri]|uniref:Uncharacterized protein n=1 Tax=Trypanosoma theileri TaxID=67003 RepID=A0A1X0P9G1_9TRYP|nr:uncharacterized protein TM35_000011500 [Trypanosoma theileri]ORC93273.1 hypothetical protein TM35_000011500 [Trypanosoma theileri]
MRFPVDSSFSDLEWKTSIEVFSAYIQHNGPTLFSFDFHPAHVPHMIYHIDGILTLECSNLIIYFDADHAANFSSMRDCMVCFTMPRDLEFIKLFEEALSSFGTEWAEVKDGESSLYHQYESTKAQVTDEIFRFEQNEDVQFQVLRSQIALMQKLLNQKDAHINHLNKQIEYLRANKMQPLQTTSVTYLVESPCISSITEKENEHTLAKTIDHLFWRRDQVNSQQDCRARVGLRGIQKLKKQECHSEMPPEEGIKTFEGVMEYLLDTSPEQLLAMYRLVFPIPATLPPNYDEVWNKFVSWVYALPEGKPSSSYVDVGRQLYTELRTIQSAHDNIEECIQTLPRVIDKPLKEEAPPPQALQKAKILIIPPTDTECYGRQLKNNQNHNSDQRENVQLLRHDSALGERRRGRSRSRGNYRSRSRSTFVKTIENISENNRTPSRHDTLSGALGRNHREVRAVDNVGVKKLQKLATLPWELPKSKKDGISPFFQGHNLFRRKHCTLLPSKEEEDRLPLQQVDVDPLSLKWIRRRLKQEAQDYFNRVWNIMRRPPTPNEEKGEPHLRIKEKDAVLLKKAGVIREASEHPTIGWVLPFTVVENQPSGQKRRLIAWAKAKNDQENYDIDVPLDYISEYLSAVYDESATLMNLKSSSFQVVLPEDIQANFRCRTESGELVQFTRLPMGYKCSLEILHTITRVLAGDPKIVKPQFAAPKELKVHVWIDSIRVSGSREMVDRWTKQIFQNMQQCEATIGEQEVITEKYEFIGVLFNHETQTISLGQKMIQKLKEAPSFRTSTMEEMEDTVFRIMYASGVRGDSLFTYYFFLKLVRQRLSRINSGFLCMQDSADLPSHALKVGEEWIKHLLKNEPVHPPRNLKTSATLVTDASMHGWGALLFKDTGEVLAAGGAWERAPHIISQGEARAVHLALRAFEAHLVDPLHICVDNTTVMNTMRRGITNSDALVEEASAIDKVLQECNIQATWSYVASENNPADGISRGKSIKEIDVAKGWYLRMEARESD